MMLTSMQTNFQYLTPQVIFPFNFTLSCSVEYLVKTLHSIYSNVVINLIIIIINMIAPILLISLYMKRQNH